MAFVAAQLNRLADGQQQLARQLFDVAAVRDLFKNHDEFIAAQPGNDIARPQACTQAAGDFHQQGVAGFMTERIVDDLEPVEIDKQHRELPLVTSRGLDRVIEQLVEGLAIGQTGQAVMRRQIFDPLVGLGLFVRALEIVERKRDIVRQALQQFDEARGKFVLLGGGKMQHTGGLAAAEQGKCRDRLCAVVAD